MISMVATGNSMAYQTFYEQFHPRMKRKVLSDSETAFFSEQKEAVSLSDMTALVLKTVIGAGMLSQGFSFRMGIGLGVLMHAIVCFLSLYCLYLFVKTGQFYKRSTYEEIWAKAFGRRSAFFVAFLSVLSVTFILGLYLRNIGKSMLSAVGIIFDSIPVWMSSTYVYMIIIDIFALFPICTSYSLREMARVSYLGLVVAVMIIFYIIYRFYERVQEYGFDPNGQLKIAHFTGDFGSQIGNIAMSYLSMPFSWPGLRNLRNPTPNRWMKVFTVSMITCFFVYLIVSVFSYCTFFDENEGDMILLMYPRDNKTLWSYIIFIVFMLSTIPSALNAARYITLNFITSAVYFDKNVWITCGFAWVIMSTFIATLSDDIFGILLTISDIVVVALLFIIPGIMYLKAFKKKFVLHLTGAIFSILFGCAVISNIVYQA